MTTSTDVTSTNHLMDITPRPPAVFTRGQGAWLWDSDGKRYLDFVQGWAVNSLGHAPDLIQQVLSQQAGQLLSPSPAFFNQPSLDTAAQLASLSVFDQVFFANSGAEANEGAIKLARRWGQKSGRHEIITFQNGFHGRTLATMSASGKAAFEPLFEPKVPGFKKAVLNDIDSVRALINEKTVAIMIEPMQGEAGVIVATDAFMAALRAITDEHHLLFIVDEIQSGVGRTGKLWAYEHAGIKPDVMTLGKGLGGGVPIAALLATNAASCFEYGDQGGTWCGNPLTTAVAGALLRVVAEPDFLSAVSENGRYLQNQLAALSDRVGHGDIRGRGLLQAMQLNDQSANQIVERAMHAGLLINAPRPDCLRLMPALNVSQQELDAMIELLELAMSQTGPAA
jgi:acetylornithine/N-succinyldiaminopimelate aminotransferase